MRRKSLAIGALALLAFTSLGIVNLRTTQHRVELQQVQLQDRGAEIKKLQLHYDLLNKDLDTELKAKQQNADRVKQLEDEKARLEQEKAKLEADLQAKAAARVAQQVAIQNAAPKFSNTAYASDGNSAKMFIYMHESGNNPNSVNRSSGACGLGQALPCSKMPCSLGDYACQDNWFTNSYMIPRYGTWENAKAFWLSHNWW